MSFIKLIAIQLNTNNLNSSALYKKLNAKGAKSLLSNDFYLTTNSMKILIALFVYFTVNEQSE
ncbi:hypothetical protein GCM10010992_04790 [Cloacibacterium rupense]|uniref:Uncharacterized protein n=1 Tax=Cloacibacterium rupense TaxID=517423 RepID=A0ABQ2NFG5_9FLAO|nr:hypothetical protein GCM10010992_04790 [Cloacibacterium rupense]